MLKASGNIRGHFWNIVDGYDHGFLWWRDDTSRTWRVHFLFTFTISIDKRRTGL